MLEPSPSWRYNAKQIVKDEYFSNLTNLKEQESHVSLPDIIEDPSYKIGKLPTSR